MKKFATLEFPDFPRADLRAHLLSCEGNIPASAVDEIVDIACHAAASARTSMLEVLDRASNPMISMTAFGLAASLALHDAERMREGLKAAAQREGVTFFEGQLEKAHG
ncbi:hypothetical protein V5F89_12320 [Pelagerythrobacter marensis]|uniref:Uncharacterized protein n=1 Tax=Pelagerythrobacter marensis TaxID=543877 RepID=A0ABZ2D2C0_9SPHN